MRLILLTILMLAVSYPTPQQDEEVNNRLVARYKLAHPAQDIIPAKRTAARHDDKTPNPLWMCADSARTLKVTDGAHYCQKGS